MRKRKANILIELLVVLSSLTSCIRVAGNSIHYYKIDNIENFNYGSVAVDLETKSYERKISASDVMTMSDHIAEGGTAPRYIIDIKEGYEDIEDNILSLNTLDDRSVIYTAAYLKSDYVYGICNVYKQTIGYLSGGGNYGEEEIAYSIYYKYDSDNDTIETLCKIDNATMVAYSGDYVIYWKNKVFYSYNISDDVETKLCDHLSYDSGLRHQSYTLVYFNDKYVVIIMKKAKTFNVDYYNVYLYEFGKDIIKLKEIK